ncbi:hypothetical protein ES703_48152 [subsurface metagenome]
MVAEETILGFLKQKPGSTIEEISETTGLSWDMTAFCLSRLCHKDLAKCLPQSHTANGLRAEYSPI